MRWKRLGLVGVAVLGAGAGTGGTFGSGETVGFDPTTVTVGEGDGQAVVTVARSACERGSFRLFWRAPRTSTNMSTATEGEDYEGRSDSGIWARCDGEGRDERVFTVPIIDDSAAEEDETIQMSLSADHTSTMSTTPLPAVDPDGEIVIADDDGLQLVARNVRVREADRVARITIERRRGGEPETGEPMEIDWQTHEGKAQAGKDFSEVNEGEVEIAGDESQATVEVPIKGDDVVEGDEDFTVGFSYGDLDASARVTIADSTARPEKPKGGGSADAPVIVISPRALQQTAKGPCLSKRRFTIRLRGMRRATVKVGDQTLKTRRTRRGLTATVDLRGRGQGRYRLRVSGRTRSGKRVVQTHSYRTCTPKRRGA